jgi:hypothetical protein
MKFKHAVSIYHNYLYNADMNTNDLTLLQTEIDSYLDIFERNHPVSNDGSYNNDAVKKTILEMTALALPDKAEADAFIQWMESHEFFTGPASTKFHACTAGGLAAHSLMVTYQSLLFALPLFQNFINTKRKDEYTFSASDIFIAAVSHDFCKAGFYAVEHRRTKDYNGNWTYEPYYKVKGDNRNLGHGNESVLLLLESLPEFIKKRPVLEAVSRHMGFCDLSDSEGYNYSNFLQNPLVMLLQLADQTAAQWWDC